MFRTNDAIANRRLSSPLRQRNESTRRNASTISQQRQAGPASLYNVSRHIIPGISQPNSVREQPGRRNQYRIHTGFGGADKRTRDGHHTAQTRSELVVERIHPPARDPRGHFSPERQRRWRFWQVGGAISQLPTRLPPLVRGRLAYSRALDLLGKQLARLDRTAPSAPNRSARSRTKRETVQGGFFHLQHGDCTPGSRRAGHHTDDPPRFRGFRTFGLDTFSVGPRLRRNSIQQFGVAHSVG